MNVDFRPMYIMLENLDRKIKNTGDVRGIMALSRGKVWEQIYEFAVISIEFDKTDCMQRIETLNAKNLELFTKCENLTIQIEELTKRLNSERTSVPTTSDPVAQEPTEL